MKRVLVVLAVVLGMLAAFAPEASAHEKLGTNCNTYTGTGGNRSLRVCIHVHKDGPWLPSAGVWFSFKEVNGDVYSIKTYGFSLVNGAGDNIYINYDFYDSNFFPTGTFINALTPTQGCGYLGNPNAVYASVAFKIQFVNGGAYTPVYWISSGWTHPCG